jgi:hypothetical protein
MYESTTAMTFASVEAEIHSPPENGPCCFRIHDQIYHMVSPLYSNEKNKPGFGLYILDSTTIWKPIKPRIDCGNDTIWYNMD